MAKGRSLLFAWLFLLMIFAAPFSDAQNAQNRNPERAKIGKLGQVNQEDVPIYLKPNVRSRVLCKAKNEQYVVLRNLTSEWATVVMADGSNGYIQAKYVDRLPFEVGIKPETSVNEFRISGQAMVSRNGSWQSQLISEAMKYIGTPYKWGGTDLRSGVDCSGFVQELYKQFGIRLPRTAEEQATVGMPVARLDQLEMGDRLYFTDGGRTRITHTGIYIGNGYFIHSSKSSGGVATEFLSEKWLRVLVDARR
ncbi:MAG TPA: C40 family peptidase [Fimbriimonadales bacterium]|nr:C40 family peptidase [Fimbriimonadales bacterium]